MHLLNGEAGSQVGSGPSSPSQTKSGGGDPGGGDPGGGDPGGGDPGTGDPIRDNPGECSGVTPGENDEEPRR